MTTLRYRVGLDFEALHQDIEREKVDDFTWYNIVESFVEYHEQVTEVVHLLSITEMCEKSERELLYYKAVFELQHDLRLLQVTPRALMTYEEYYDKLLQSQPMLMADKMRLQGTLNNGIRFTIDCHRETNYTIMQFENVGDLDICELWNIFPSVQWRVQEDMSMEELFFEFNMNLLQEHERKQKI